MKKIFIFFISISLIIISPYAFAKNSKDISNTQVKKKTISHKKKYGFNIVKNKDGHPVRSGEKSYRFEVRYGDCGKDEGHNDCKKDILDYLSISEKEFFEIVNKFRSPHLWEKKKDKWFLKKAVWMLNK